MQTRVMQNVIHNSSNTELLLLPARFGVYGL